MEPVTQDETLNIDFQHDAFEALKSQVGTGATDDPSQNLLIDVSPFAYTNGQYPLTPDLVEWGKQSAIPAGSDILQTLVYTNPFTLSGSASGTALQEYVVINYLFDVSVLAGGSDFVIPVGLTEDLPTNSLGSGTVILAPNVSPVTSVTIDGEPIDGATGFGGTPTISWTAPATGVVTGYSVNLELLAYAGTPPLTAGGTLYTATTSVQVPPGLITVGDTYVAVITAYVAPNWDLTTTPFITPMPVSQCSMVTGMLQP